MAVCGVVDVINIPALGLLRVI